MMTAALRRLTERRRVWIAAGAALVLVVALVVTGVANADDSGDYRTAVARTGDVASTLDAAGTVTPTSEADLSFPIAGQVSSVPVAVGQQVAAGTTLASLDTTSLDAAVAQARSTLATAQAKLDADRSGQSSAASGSSAVSGAGAGASGTAPASFAGSSVVLPAVLTLGAPPSDVSPALTEDADDTFAAVSADGPSPSVSSALVRRAGDTFDAVPAGLTGPAVSAAGGDGVAKAQAAVLADQRTVDGLLAAAQRDLTAETTACTPVLAATAADPATTPGSASAGSGAADPGSTAPGSAGAGPTGSRSAGSGSAGSGSAGSGSAGSGSGSTGSSRTGGHAAAAVFVTGGGTLVPIATSSTAAELAACQSAITIVMAGQQAVGSAQRTLATDESALDAALTAAIASGSGASGSGAGGSGVGGSGVGGGGDGSGSGAGGSGAGGSGSGSSGTGGSETGGTGSGGAGAGGAGAGGAGGSAGAGTGQTPNGQNPNGMGANGTGANGAGAARAGSGAGQREGTAGGAAGAGRSGGQGSTGTGHTVVVSAAQLAADQAQVDSASAQLTTAEQNRDQATLVAPIAGTVAAVNLTAGQQVGGSAGSAQVVVIGPGADEVVVPIPESTIGSVHVGDATTIVADGSDQQLTGTVASVGLLPSGTGSLVTYPVTIALTGTPPALPAGSGATVTVTVASATAVLTVPTSAVHTGPGGTTVDVLRSGKPTTVTVTVGATGATATQVTSGLREGDQVVLADLSQPLPTGGTAGLRTLGGGAAGGGGGGGGGGGRAGG